jgi:hypothetical protein
MSGTWELFALNPSSPHETQLEKKATSPLAHPPTDPPTRKKVRTHHSMIQLLIGCTEILFLKLVATIFGLDY